MEDFTVDIVAKKTTSILVNDLPEIDRKMALKQILGMIDLTTLSGDDTNERVTELCEKAKSFFDGAIGIPNVAAVCVYPIFSKTVHRQLKGTDIKTACVAGAFPSGQSPLSARLIEVKYAVDHGADEIDMVISRGRMIAGDVQYLEDEIRLHKQACGDAHLKVILETGELQNLNMVYDASKIAIKSGGDFLKTSTGKIQPAATHEAFWVMMLAIKKHYQQTGEKIGIKAAGGIANTEDALNYYALVRAELGEAWLTPELFRIGASRLADNLYNDILQSAN